MLVCRYYCRNIGCICMALQLRPDRQVSALLFWPDFDFVWFISQPHMLQFSLLIRWKANPAKPNWERLRKYFSGNLKFIRLLAGLASDTVEHLDWQTDFIFIHLRDFQRRFSEYDDNDNSNDDAHAPISAETHVRSKNSTRELGDWGSGIGDRGAVAALWFIALTLPAWCCLCASRAASSFLLLRLLLLLLLNRRPTFI